MKIKDLKKIIEHLPDNGQVWAEDKISGEKLPFEVLMGVYTNSSSITFYLR
jgi:hypothetical protein